MSETERLLSEIWRAANNVATPWMNGHIEVRAMDELKRMMLKTMMVNGKVMWNDDDEMPNVRR